MYPGQPAVATNLQDRKGSTDKAVCLDQCPLAKASSFTRGSAGGSWCQVAESGPADDRFVFAFSDANFERYGLTAQAGTEIQLCQDLTRWFESLSIDRGALRGVVLAMANNITPERYGSDSSVSLFLTKRCCIICLRFGQARNESRCLFNMALEAPQSCNNCSNRPGTASERSLTQFLAFNPREAWEDYFNPGDGPSGSVSTQSA